MNTLAKIAAIALALAVVAPAFASRCATCSGSSPTPGPIIKPKAVELATVAP